MAVLLITISLDINYYIQSIAKTHLTQEGENRGRWVGGVGNNYLVYVHLFLYFLKNIYKINSSCYSFYDMLVTGYAEINKVETLPLWDCGDQSLVGENYHW